MAVSATNVKELNDLLQTHKLLREFLNLYPDAVSRKDREQCLKAIFEEIDEIIKKITPKTTP